MEMYMQMSSFGWWIILFFTTISFLLYGFGRISKGNSKIILEFTGGTLILLSITTMFILYGVISGIILLLLSMLIVAPFTGFIMAWLEKKLYQPKIPLIFCKHCNFKTIYNYDNLTFYYCGKDIQGKNKTGWNFENNSEYKKYHCKHCGEVLRRFVLATFHSTCPICERGRLDVTDKDTKLYHLLHVMTDKQRQDHLKGLYGVVGKLQMRKVYDTKETFKKNLQEDQETYKQRVKPELKERTDKMVKAMVESLNKEMLRKYGHLKS